jgi:16S rRNA (uracil1498-N3)-methyltransferase
MSARFYLNWPLTPGPVEMTGPEARHLATVCRFRAGDQLCLFNGDGHEYPARVVAVSKKSVCLDIERRDTPSRELAFSLTIAAPIPKGDCAQFLVEKLTELGVRTFVPLLCERAVIEPREGKIDKLERYVVEASKQCGRNVLMSIEGPLDWASFCQRGESSDLRILAHPTRSEVFLLRNKPACVNSICAVGPEGGFTEQEVARAVTNGWEVANLGPRILRIETAALVLATTVILHRPV